MIWENHLPPANAHLQTDATPPTISSWPARLLVAHDRHQDAAVVSFDGEIDLGNAPVLRNALQSALEQHTGPVVVDLSKVPFMDSSGVHVLVETLRRLEPQNRPLALVCHEGGQVHRLLGLVGLIDAVTVYSDAPGPRTLRAPAIH